MTITYKNFKLGTMAELPAREDPLDSVECVLYLPNEFAKEIVKKAVEKNISINYIYQEEDKESIIVLCDEDIDRLIECHLLIKD